jgi:hypothetical protein
MQRKDRYLTMWKHEPKSKKTYIDQILTDGKKKEKSVPGPCTYSPDRIAIEKPRSFSQIMSKGKRMTNIDLIMKEQKKSVGPNAYKI